MSRRIRRKTEEQEFQDQIITAAKLFGWRWYHTYDSRRSPAGFLDLVLVRTPRLVISEVKKEDGRVTPDQRVWMEDLRGCPGVEVYLWRPSDWQEIERVLR